MPQNLSKQFVEKAKAVTAKRARTVIDHILAHGQITTEELKNTYGYNHPPRAARDVREQGIPLKTVRVVGSDGRQIGAYVFDEAGGTFYSKRAGRTALSNHLKVELVQKHGARCFIYLEAVPERDLQIDHRVPYEVAGDVVNKTQDSGDFMLLCGSANRAKSWSCEHCQNWLQGKDVAVCKTCYWAHPECYSHVAMVAQRRLDIVWNGDEVAQFEAAKAQAVKSAISMPEYVKRALKNIAHQ